MKTARRNLEKIEGHVEPSRVLRGTASEHTGVVLTTEEGEKLILQRVGANPFQDADTQDLCGQDVSLEGFRLGNIFRYTRSRVHSLT